MKNIKNIKNMWKIIIIIIILLFSIIGCSPNIEDNSVKKLYNIEETTEESTEEESCRYTKYQLIHNDPFKREIVIILEEKEGYIRYMDVKWGKYIDSEDEIVFSRSMEKSNFLKKYEIKK